MKVSIDKVIKLISGGFDGLETQLERNLQVRMHSTTKMISFQKTIEKLNSKLHELAQRHADLKGAKNIDYIQKKISKKIYDIEIRLISYMSLWNINVQQNVISKDSVKKSLGKLLYEEKIVVGNVYNYLLENKDVSHHIDAENCRDLFSACIPFKDIKNNNKKGK